MEKEVKLMLTTRNEALDTSSKYRWEGYPVR